MNITEEQVMKDYAFMNKAERIMKHNDCFFRKFYSSNDKVDNITEIFNCLKELYECGSAEKGTLKYVVKMVCVMEHVFPDPIEK